MVRVTKDDDGVVQSPDGDLSEVGRGSGGELTGRRAGQVNHPIWRICPFASTKNVPLAPAPPFPQFISTVLGRSKISWTKPLVVYPRGHDTLHRVSPVRILAPASRCLNWSISSSMASTSPIKDTIGETDFPTSLTILTSRDHVTLGWSRPKPNRYAVCDAALPTITNPAKRATSPSIAGRKYIPSGL